MDPSDQAHRAPADSSSRQEQPAFYPPVSQAVNHVPLSSPQGGLPEKTYAGSKRKRPSTDNYSDRVLTWGTTTSDFDDRTKEKAKQQNNYNCWHCEAEGVQVSHVFGSKDPTFHKVRAQGMIDFQQKQDLQNSIVLCHNCHANYDNVYDPSLFFLPTDLGYFLDFERTDRKRRRKYLRRTGVILKRACPTANTYQEHQRLQGIEGAETGGLYTRIVLKDIFAHWPGRDNAFQPGLSQCGATKPWTGSPMAALQRAIIMMGQLDLSNVPQEIRDRLRQLQDLYSEKLDLDGSDASSPSSVVAGALDDNELEKEEGEKKEERSRDKRKDPKAKSSQSIAGQTSASGNTEQDEIEYKVNKYLYQLHTSQEIECPDANLQRSLAEDESRCGDVDCSLAPSNDAPGTWCWGPGGTSEDAAKFFRKVQFL